MGVFFAYYQDLVNQKRKNILDKIKCSFEFFPPKNIDSEKKFWSMIQKINMLNPYFFSVTHGANNGEREKTYNLVKKIYNKTGVVTAAHLTCVGFTRDELQEIAEKYWNNGIRNIVALRGDSDNKSYKHTMYASDLVRLLKNVADFDIAVAAYPELHPESQNSQLDIMSLKKKIDAGANKIITQFFFNIDKFLRFRDNCVKNKIFTEIIPGILPIYTFNQLYRFANMTNVSIPKWMFEIFDGLESDVETQKILGSGITIDMVRNLSREGIKNFHFYTLNQSEIVCSVCRILSI